MVNCQNAKSWTLTRKLALMSSDSAEPFLDLRFSSLPTPEINGSLFLLRRLLRFLPIPPLCHFAARRKTMAPRLVTSDWLENHNRGTKAGREGELNSQLCVTCPFLVLFPLKKL